MPTIIAFYFRISGRTSRYRAPGGNFFIGVVMLLGFAIIAVEISNLLKL
jgi:hypothetical protein